MPAYCLGPVETVVALTTRRHDDATNPLPIFRTRGLPTKLSRSRQSSSRSLDESQWLRSAYHLKLASAGPVGGCLRSPNSCVLRGWACSRVVA